MVINAGQCHYAARSRRSGASRQRYSKRKGETSMTSRNLKRFAASGGTAALVLAGMLFLGSALTSRAHSEGAGSDNGLEGAWRLQVTVRDCQTGEELRPPFPALFTFA